MRLDLLTEVTKACWESRATSFETCPPAPATAVSTHRTAVSIHGLLSPSLGISLLLISRKIENLEALILLKGKMEKLQQQQYWRGVRSLLSYKNATIVVCLLNIISAFILLQGFFFTSHSSRLASSSQALYRHVKESEDIRRMMVPVDLIRRVREIGKDVSVETEPVNQKDIKQTAAEDLISRLNNFRSYSDVGNVKALEEWRKRKMERAKQRST